MIKWTVREIIEKYGISKKQLDHYRRLKSFEFPGPLEVVSTGKGPAMMYLYDSEKVHQWFEENYINQPDVSDCIPVVDVPMYIGRARRTMQSYIDDHYLDFPKPIQLKIPINGNRVYYRISDLNEWRRRRDEAENVQEDDWDGSQTLRDIIKSKDKNNLDVVIKVINTKLGELNSKTSNHSARLLALEKLLSGELIKQAKEDSTQVHEIYRSLMNKFCIVTECWYLAKQVFADKPDKLNEVSKKILDAMDYYDNEYWDAFEDKPIEEAFKELLK